MLYTKPLSAAILGCVLHVLVFVRGEYHTHTPKMLRGYVVFIFAVFLIEREYSTSTSYAWNAILSTASHLLGLFGSITMYRICFHPLRAFPGPRSLKVSKLFHVSRVLNGQNHVFLEKIRREYGSFVRTGPSEVTVYDPAIFHAISGPGTTCIKSAWYDMLHPLVAINSIREKDGYASRRRMWDQSFKVIALKRDGPTILTYANKLLKHIETTLGEPIIINEWLSRFSYAVMSDLAFARPYGSLDDEQLDRNVAMIHRGTEVLGVVSPAPWLAQLLFSIPGVTYRWNRMLKWASDNMKERIHISSWLIEAAQSNDGLVDTNGLYGDALAVAIAGSHSTAATLTFLLYELSRNAGTQHKLRLELSKIAQPLDVDALTDLPNLNACIDETLRLYPILLTAGARQTKETGITISGRYIPPWTTIIAPRYSIGRLEACFERASEFIPERWTEKPEMVKNSRAHNPFSIGRHTCPGRYLGLTEVRIVVALLLSRFEVTLAPAKRNETEVVDGMKDNFTVHPGQLKLIFRPL
ncbi:cytochrome P450 [Trematosphaeria pertusa]|uniref:Cytochrome P450 n=1 Tax=Trematosphaeria pertusa TaxID=390896 RepID=A0A6A6J286_9PLEO|nr:cytochrome P450 [Trematosphaeria pertusa]KAF2256020.1 cytochrome P450 [Trematosphaeria pertusa]